KAFRLGWKARSLTRTVPHSVPNLTRAREAFVYSIRRRSLRFAQLLGTGPGQAQECLQQALTTFLTESRSLPLSAWSDHWWVLLHHNTSRFPKTPPFTFVAESDAWKQRWNQLPETQRAALLLRLWLGLDAARVGVALGMDSQAAAREMALASLQLRRALDADS